MRDENRNTVWADAIVDELARAGVRTVCVAPGSRSTPLVMACADHPTIRVFTQIDERSAGYFALGVGKGAGGPAAVITTSGTAAANLYPAVIEAAQSETPLIVLTADRPGFLRDTDANQTIDQLRLFGPYARYFADVPAPDMRPAALRALRSLAARGVAAALPPTPGPVHLNFPFDKPLEPTRVDGDVPADLASSTEHGVAGRPGSLPYTTTAPGVLVPALPVLEALSSRINGEANGVIVAGPMPAPWQAGPAILRLAAVTGYPVLADPLSGARFAPGASACSIAHYDAFLQDDDTAARLSPGLVLRFGATPTSSALAAFLERCRNVEQVVFDAAGRWKDHTATASAYVRSEPSATAVALADRAERRGETPWGALWKAVDRATGDALAAELAGDEFEPAVVAGLAAGLPNGTQLVIGNSMPVRHLDRFGPARDVALRVHGNRGTSGIDGIVSTALGAAAGARAPTVAALGDLSFLYDLNGLFAARDLDVPVVFVVINNDGGGIFSSLPARLFEPAFTRHMIVPHGLDFEHAAALHDLPFARVSTAAAVGEAVAGALARGGCSIVEVRADRDRSRQRGEDALRVACEAARACAINQGETG